MPSARSACTRLGHSCLPTRAECLDTLHAPGHSSLRIPAEKECPPDKQGDMYALVLFFLGSVVEFDIAMEIMKGAKGMEGSVTYQRVFDEGILKGLQQGKQQGIMEGIQQGKQQGMRVCSNFVGNSRRNLRYVFMILQ